MRVCAATRQVGATGGRVLYSRDVPKNQQAASRAYRGLQLAAKKERMQQTLHTPRRSQQLQQQAQAAQQAQQGAQPPLPAATIFAAAGTGAGLGAGGASSVL